MNAPKEAVIKMYAAREEIYPREVKGRYATLRWACVWLTQLLFYGLPWIGFNGRQAVLFDLGARKFHLFELVLWPQDFIYLAALLIVCAYGLFLVTTVAGRVWCGFACPQTVYTELFLWIERRIEGARSARIRLDRQPWSLDKIGKKTAKHAAWLLVALWTGFSFVGYFTPVRSLMGEILALDLGPWEAFWVLLYGFATYGNAGWMREQVCKYMCPYARFQSAMFDKDTLIVTYDRGRGEPCAPLGHAAQAPAGDCIGCNLCVQVCPTGIDIRRGLQYECIGCAACIDACDGVMEKTGKPAGLIRYATENALVQGWGPEKMRQRLLRPRVLAYTAVLVLMLAAMTASLALRVPLKVDVIRDRGSMGREVDGGWIENVYRLQLMNTSEVPRRLHLRVDGLAGAVIVEQAVVALDGASTRALPVRVRIPPETGKPGSNRIEFTITALDDAAVAVREEAAFIVPR
ncbi:cytochrome c oxidase accessory protein CcoG [Telluria aromaticivorans]|uniref:Cytochrome c oxidase accessory protein CcoG n=1 Tax=Telluria aromaticivorans TaxID=2725995 RepID=A0A7Y2JYI1_9BURK|nr:cytochrome c oxidase accessory protein CcoG [Telluria aromaticivorans]NNG22885.1 cytochrome c oxidase accessory protein CcoG [Telluria aromaticivorans]